MRNQESARLKSHYRCRTVQVATKTLKFAQDMSARLGLRCGHLSDSYDRACRGADINRGRDVNLSGHHFCSTIGSGEGVVSMRSVGENEAMDDVYAKCDRFFVDYDPATRTAIRLISNMHRSWSHWAKQHRRADLEVVAGRKPGRQKSQEKILAGDRRPHNPGHFIAYRVYLRAKAEGRGLRLHF